MSGQNVGYVRVSSVDQNLERQLVGVDLDEVFEDKASGKDVERKGLTACLKHLRKGDTLHVHSIDRLARNMSDLLNIVNDLNLRGVAIQFHKEKLTFTGEENNPFQTLQLQMMGAFAEFERALIKERQREGMQIAKAKGKQIGAKRKLTPEQVEEIKEKIALGAPKKALALEYGISRQTLYSAIG